MCVYKYLAIHLRIAALPGKINFKPESLQLLLSTKTILILVKKVWAGPVCAFYNSLVQKSVMLKHNKQNLSKTKIAKSALSASLTN